MNMKNCIESMVENAINQESLRLYMVASTKEQIGVYSDGSVRVGSNVGMEVPQSERPVVAATCPGLENIDISCFREGWESAGYSDEDVIRICCRDGDLSTELKELRTKLLKSIVGV